MASPPLEPGAAARVLITPQVPSSWPLHGLGPSAALLPQLPPIERLPSGAWVGVTSGTAPARSWWQRLRGERSERVHLASRCMALALAGYVDICAAEGVAFGRVPPPG
ncbi:MAG: hypothetical protein KIT72_11250 [Polyangiaceae bacterium]|nr:hypothetical protein [Polyangiaceae bacterium]MCW5790988.1 hypothetical protein [Polyangiaceae bacterium]